MTQTIALLTDFGLEDVYVGVMKAVMRGICPQATFIDITHAIQPQNIRHGAFALCNAYRYFPAGTTFLVVVDPGVGSVRRPVAVSAGGYMFVAPDNGVLAYALAEIGAYQAVELDNVVYHLPHVSRTFHGRDIFAPVAAHLAMGVDLAAAGTPLPKLKDFPAPQLTVQEDSVIGEVLHIDHFGNVITSIGTLQWVDKHKLRLSAPFGSPAKAVEFLASDVEVLLNEQTFTGVARTYSEAQPGEALITTDSNGFLEVAINQGDCAARLGTVIGDPVLLKHKG